MTDPYLPQPYPLYLAEFREDEPRLRRVFLVVGWAVDDGASPEQNAMVIQFDVACSQGMAQFYPGIARPGTVISYSLDPKW